MLHNDTFRACIFLDMRQHLDNSHPIHSGHTDEGGQAYQYQSSILQPIMELLYLRMWFLHFISISLAVPFSMVLSLKIPTTTFVISLDAPSAISDFDPYMITNFAIVADSWQIEWNWNYTFSFHFFQKGLR